MVLKTKHWLALSLVPQVLLVKVLGSNPEWVETYYSEGIYPYISRFLRFLFGWAPFSVGDLFYTLLTFAAIRYLYLHGRTIWQRPKRFLVDLGGVLAVAYFIFHLFWGMNYYRLPLEEKLGIGREYSVAELETFTHSLVDRSNHYQLLLTKDSTKAVQIPYTRPEIFNEVLSGFDSLATNYPGFTYERPSIKKSIYSLALTYMGYGGYLNPFTNEAQVNGIIPIVRYPTVSAHEIGHQVGYSSESDTNFIGFLTCSKVSDPYYKYASYSHALGYCLSDLRKKDREKFDAVWKNLNPGVKKNYAEIRDFWRRYENPTEPVFKAMFNAYLKANNQEDGIQSYNKVVGLLVNYDKRYGF